MNDLVMKCIVTEEDDYWLYHCNLLHQDIAIGYIDLYGDDNHIAYLQYIYRNPDQKYRGMGMLMLCSLLDNLKKQRNITQIRLEAENDILIVFYKKYGFKTIDGLKMSADINDVIELCSSNNNKQELNIIFETNNIINV